MYLKKWAAPSAVILTLAACQTDRITSPNKPRATTDQQCIPETCDPGGGGVTFIIRVIATPAPNHVYSNRLEGAYVTSNCGNAFADVLGQAEITCTTGSSITGTVVLRDGSIIVKALQPGNVEVSTDKNFSGSGGGIITVVMPNDTTAWVYRILHKAVQTANSEFQASPVQQVKVVTGWGAGNSNCSGSANACYEWSANRIVLNSQQIYAPYGGSSRFIQTHELGHAFETQAIEPAESYTCTEHSLETPTDRDCAWGEGFADFFAARYAQDQSWTATIENYHTANNGLLIEMGVASVLHDLFDGINTYDGISGDDDTIEWPLPYLKDAMSTCHTDVTGQAYPIRDKINGLDMLLACMEHNAAVRLEAPQYFQNTWQVITGYSESATEPSNWTAARVRQAWLYDLYEVGSLP